MSFEPYKVKMILEDLAKNTELWDIVTLEISHTVFPLTIKHLPPHRLAVYLTAVTYTGAYLINRKAPKKLLQKALPIKMPVDHYFTRQWAFGIQLTGIENPRLVHQVFRRSDMVKTDPFVKEGER